MLKIQSCVNYVYRPLVQVEEPQSGRSTMYLPRGFDRQSQYASRFPQVTAIVIFLKTLCLFNIKIGDCSNLYLCIFHNYDTRRRRPRGYRCQRNQIGEDLKKKISTTPPPGLSSRARLPRNTVRTKPNRLCRRDSISYVSSSGLYASLSLNPHQHHMKYTL